MFDFKTRLLSRGAQQAGEWYMERQHNSAPHLSFHILGTRLLGFGITSNVRFVEPPSLRRCSSGVDTRALVRIYSSSNRPIVRRMDRSGVSSPICAQ